jgi:hypothetical protein
MISSVKFNFCKNPTVVMRQKFDGTLVTMFWPDVMSQSHTNVAIMTWQSTSSFDTQSWKLRPCHIPKYGRDRPNVALVWRPDYDKTIPLSFTKCFLLTWYKISFYARFSLVVSKKKATKALVPAPSFCVFAANSDVTGETNPLKLGLVQQQVLI